MSNAVIMDTNTDQGAAPAGHDDNMANKFDNQGAPAQGNNDQSGDGGSKGDQRPEWLPEKFKSPEEMSKAYLEMEKKLGSQGQDDSGTNDQSGQDDGNKDANNNATADEVISKASMMFYENGKLDDQMYKDLSDAGYSKELVDAYMAGQDALASQQTAVAYEEAGGQEQFDAMKEWAETGLSDEDAEAFNKAIVGSEAEKRMAVRDLKTKYEAAYGKDPSLLNGDSSSTGDVYANWEQVTAAMKDPKYQADPAYRKSVEEKVARSPL